MMKLFFYLATQCEKVLVTIQHNLMLDILRGSQISCPSCLLVTNYQQYKKEGICKNEMISKQPSSKARLDITTTTYYSYHVVFLLVSRYQKYEKGFLVDCSMFMVVRTKLSSCHLRSSNGWVVAGGGGEKYWENVIVMAKNTKVVLHQRVQATE